MGIPVDGLSFDPDIAMRGLVIDAKSGRVATLFHFDFIAEEDLQQSAMKFNKKDLRTLFHEMEYTLKVAGAPDREEEEEEEDDE